MSEENKSRMLEIGKQARESALKMSSFSSAQKSEILDSMAASVESAKSKILAANAEDVSDGIESGLTTALVDRLTLTDSRFSAMVQGLRDLSKLSDPVGDVINERERPNGLNILKVRVPIGVIGIIYESRPNVTADAAGLCLRTSNAVILKGGKEAARSNRTIADALIKGGRDAGMPEHAVQLVDFGGREAVKELLQLEDYLDMVVPRGGESLIRAVAEMSRVPVLKHYKGVCHTFVDKDANLEMALDICENAKVQRPGVCNAMETLLVHQEIAEEFLPQISQRLVEKAVELRGDDRSRELVSEIKPASEADWDEEYLDLILAVKIVRDVEDAIDHINLHGSRHSDAIVTESAQARKAFVQGVDAGVVFVNASTRFNDGAEFGLGAEMGISTDKLHARGPVGPEELTTYKYIVQGSGQIRS